MKKVLALVAALVCIACASPKAVQVSVVQAELVKVDTVYRLNGNVQLLTWRSKSNIEFVSYAGIQEHYLIGLRMPVFLPR